jgi:hypothetical protein
VEEDESAMPKKDSRLMLAKFNEQMEKVHFNSIKYVPAVLRIRIRDPVLFCPLDPGSGSGMNFFRIQGVPMFFGEKLAPETIKARNKLVLFFIPIFMYSRIRDPVLFHAPDPG